jgi:lipid-A-disaccharide synthase
MAFMGFIAVIKNARTILNNLTECKLAILEFNPDVLILVDYPSFNLRIARFVKENLKTPVYYYISPKIWAWKEYRIKEIKKYVDKIFCIFPFEVDFYAKHNYKVEYVGNPSVDSIFSRYNQHQTFDKFCSINNFVPKPIIALLAGSRKQEISACLPRMLDAALKFKDYQIVIAAAPGIEPVYYESYFQHRKAKIVIDQTYELLQQSRVAVVNSGTATLETALIGVPQVVVYHVALGHLAYFLKNIFIKIKFISLVNIVAQKEVVKELVAHLFTVKNVTKELEQLMNNDSYRQTMQSEYINIKKSLGDVGAAKKCAKKMYEMLKLSKKAI